MQPLAAIRAWGKFDRLSQKFMHDINWLKKSYPELGLVVHNISGEPKFFKLRIALIKLHRQSIFVLSLHFGKVEKYFR